MITDDRTKMEIRSKSSCEIKVDIFTLYLNVLLRSSFLSTNFIKTKPKAQQNK